MSSQPVQSVDEVREQLLADVRRCAASVRSRAWWRAGLVWLTVVLLALVLLTTLDFLLRREETGLRVLSLVALLAVIVWAALKFLRPIVAFRPTPLQLARWVETQNPSFGRRLSTVVEISEMGPNEKRYGSRYFQEAVLRDWSAEKLKPDWQGFFDSSQLWKAVGPLAVVCTMIALGAVLRPVETQLALKRLAVPWSANAWPRREQLEFRGLPRVVGIGSEIQLEVIDQNPPFPQEIFVLLRDPQREELEVVSIPTQQIEDIAIANLPAQEHAIEVRAVGGDDQNMPWQRIDVVAPPRLDEFRFEIVPPSYTGIEPSELVGNRIQVLSGSRVKFYGKLNEAIAGVTLKGMSGDALSSSEQAWNVELARDSKSISTGGAAGAEFLHSISWRFVFKTSGGLNIETSETWSVEVVIDNPPEVSLDPPAMRRSASNAKLQIQGNARDDLRLVEITAWAQAESDSESEPARMLVWQGDDTQVRELGVDQAWDFASAIVAQRPATQSPLGAVIRKGLVPGDVINFWLEARDSRGQIGRSQKERLEIQSTDNILNEILDRQTDLLARIRELVESQRRNVQLAEQARERLSEARPISQQDVDAFSGVAELQRAIASGLAADRSGIAEEVRDLRRLLELNELRGLPADDQLQLLEEEIELIAQGVMRAATDATTSAQALVRDQFSRNEEAKSPMIAKANQSVETQTTALEALLKLTDRVDRSGAIQQIQRDFSSVATQQTLLQEDTNALQLDGLNAAAPDEMDRRKEMLSDEQLSLAQRLDSLIARSRELVSGDSDEVSELVEPLKSATEVLTEGQATRLMRQAKEQIDSERFAGATETQESVARLLSDALRKIRSQTTQRTDSNLQGRAEDLRETSQLLSTLANDQTRLAQRMREGDATRRPADLATKLATEQAQIAQSTTQQANQAEAEGDQRTAEAIRKATENQEVAEQLANQQQMQPAADAAEQAAERLEDAAAELEQRAAALEGQAQQQQLYQLSNQLEQLASEQQSVVRQLNSLGDLVDNDFESQARQMASEQEAVRQRLAEARRQADKLPTFAWALEQVETDMARSAAAAQRYRIAPEAITAASDALTKLELAVEASSSSSDAPSDPARGEPEENSDARQGQSLPPLASLKLLRGLQNQINEQTQLTDTETDPSRRKIRLKVLSQQQQELGEQLGELLKELNRDLPDEL